MQSFEFINTEIEGLVLIKPRFIPDERGYLLKSFEREAFCQNKIPTIFYEDFESLSQKGTLRGIHFQYEYPQGKLVRVIRGAAFEVAVDLRINSKTFGKWCAFQINDVNKHMLYLPEGFGSAFLALEDNTLFSYKCTDRYSPKYESGIIWNDTDINIKWPLEQVEKLIISERDKGHPSFQEYIKNCKENR